MADDTQQTPAPATGATYLPLVRQLENSGDSAVSPAGAIGRYQIMPGTARQYGFDPSKLTDPDYNTKAATAILDDLHRRFNGDVPAILAGYNGGPSAANRWIASGRDMSVLQPETQNYIAKASSIMQGGNLPKDFQVTSTNSTPDLPPQPPELAPGQKAILRLQQSGQFSDSDIAGYYQRQTSKLLDGGYKPDEIQGYWGEQKANQSVIDQYVERNLHAAGADGGQKIADSPMEAFAAGYNMSVTHLRNADVMPNTVVPEDAPIFNKIMEASGRTLGDFPYMVAGGVGGGAVGAELTHSPAGTLIGAGAGAAGLPAAMREIYLDRLRLREIQTPSEFLGMAGKSLLNVGEQTALGGLSAYAGGKVGLSLMAAGVNRVASATAGTLTNAATYTSLSSAIQGKIPSWQDAVSTAVVALGIHGATEVGGRLVPTRAATEVADNQTKIWAQTGLTPQEQVQKAQTDPQLAQEMMARDVTGEPVIPGFRAQAPDEPKPYTETEPVAEKAATEPAKETPEKTEEAAATEETEGNEPAKMTAEDLNEKAAEFIGEAKTDPWWKKLVPDFSKFYNQWVSELGLAREIDDRSITEGGYDRAHEMGLEDWLRQTYASTQRSSFMMVKGGVNGADLTVNKDIPSLRDAAQAVQEDGGNVADWVNYMVAKRANIKEGQGFETGHPLSLEERQRLVDLGEGKYERGTEMWNRAMDGVLDYAQARGLFSETQVAAMKRDNPMYISFRRMSGDEAPAERAGGRGFKVREPVKTFEGSDKQIVNPLLATMDNMRLIVQMADRNVAAQYLGNLIDKGTVAPEDLGIERVADEDVDVTRGAAKVAEPYQLGHNGGPPLEDDVEPYEPILAQRALRGMGKNTFMIIRDGKPEFYTAKDPALAGLIRGAESPGELGMIGKVANAFAKLQRSGITLPIDFPLRILALRHPITAAIFDPAHPTPFATMMKGVLPVLTDSDAYNDWLVKGGAGASIVELDRNVVQTDIQNVFQETGTWNKLWNTVQPGNWLAASQLVMGKLDAMARVGYTGRVQAADPSIDPIKAATMSRKAMMDYSERAAGAISQRMAQLVPFFRPDILGLKMAAEGVKADPMGTALHAFLYVTVPSLVLYGLNYLQDEYGNLPEDQKYKNMDRMVRDTNYVLPQVGGVRMRVPYPFQAGAPFGALVNRFLDHWRDTDLDAFDKWSKNLVGQFFPNIMPGYVEAPFEWWANKNWSTGKPLMSDSLLKASGPMEYTPYTTEASKKISQIAYNFGADISPVNLDRATQDLTGTLGFALLKAGNYALRPDDPKPMQLADYPFIGSFLARTPGMNSAPIQEFYDHKEQIEKAAGDKALAVQRMKARDPQGAEQLQSVLDQWNAKVAQANATAKAIRVAMSVIDGVNNDPLKTADEIAKMSITERNETHAKTVDDKRQLIDQWTGIMINLARAQLGVWNGSRDTQQMMDQYRQLGAAANGNQ